MLFNIINISNPPLLTDEQTQDLTDLQLHLIHRLKKFGLRVYEEKIAINSNTQLQDHLTLADCMGIPYSLIITESSLKNGLMHLRNRDTTLKEIIHISDIDNYLLKIFT